MEFILSIAEQVDKAASELAIAHPINDRLALILIDNAAELILRRKIHESLISYGDFNKATATIRKRARSQKLDDRLRALVETGLMPPGEAAFVVAAHKQRNLLYHENGGREPFVRSLAFVYYRRVCDLFPRFAAGWQLIIGVSQMTEIGRRYALAGAKRGIGLGDFGPLDVVKVTEEALSRLPIQSGETFQEELGDAAEEARTRIADALRFLIADNPRGFKGGELIRMAQLDFSRQQVLTKAGLEDANWESARYPEAAKLAKEHDAKFKPRYRAIPHGAWTLAARRIREEPDPEAAFVRFDRLMSDMRDLREAIGDLANSLDAWIQSEVDRIRGK